MSNKYNTENVEITHLGWDIPTKLRFDDGGNFAMNNAHGGDPVPVPKGKVVQFLGAEIKDVAEHLAMLRNLKNQVDGIKSSK